ncbi:MAG TPA: hypothetical protein VK582_26225 [Pyrinomonadaceae bacterium]|nr:hypothetical protein [Pyrinomonadaceae bacterium]
MKTILRATSLLLLLLAFAMPLCAQNPNVAIRIDAGTGVGEYCVKGTLKNLRPTTVGVTYIELWIYDAKTCKRICVTRKVINQKIKSCDTLDFDLCCKNPSPAFVPAIYYVRVHHSAGINEEWAFPT